MTRLRLFFICLAALLLAACATAQPAPAPTAIAVAQAPVTNTPVLPTATATALPVTNTAVPTATPTIAPQTETTTPLPANTPTVTPVNTALAIPPVDGYLIFFWDTKVPLEEPSYYSIPVEDPKQDLYVAIPDESPDSWQISPILKDHLNWTEELTSWPVVALSPDQTKFAFTIFKKIDDNSDVTSIYVVDFSDGTIVQLTEEYYPRIYNISWLPDNQKLAYSVANQGFLIQIDQTAEQFTPDFSVDIDKLEVSPDGQMVAIILQSGELVLINLETKEVLSTPIESLVSPDNLAWSPDSNWLALNQVSGAGLLLLDVQTNEYVSLVETYYFGVPSWSPVSSQLAFIQGTREDTDLYLWDPESQHSRFIDNLGYYRARPIWSSQGEYFVVGSEKEEVAHLLLYITQTDEVKTIPESENMQNFTVLSWSPDEQWLLAFAASEDRSCLYLINPFNEGTYCAIDTTGTLNPFEVFWLPEIPHLP